MAALEGCVQRLHQLDCALVAFGGADDDAVGLHEVFDGGAFFEELGVRDHAEGDALAPFCQLVGYGGPYLVAGADGDGGFVDDEFVAGHAAGDVARGREHVFQVCRAVFIGRRADGNELQLPEGDGFVDVGGEPEPAGGDVAGDDLIEAGLVDGDATGIQCFYFAGVKIKAQDVVT